MKVARALLLSLVLSPAYTLDWTEGGKNWEETLCHAGWYQSPINVDPRSTVQNNKVKYIIDYAAYENLTLIQNITEGFFGVQIPS